MTLSIQLQASLDVICDHLLGLAETQSVGLDAVANGELIFRPRTPGRVFPSIRLRRVTSAADPEVWELTVAQGSAEDRTVMETLLRQLAAILPVAPRMGASMPV